MAPKQCPGKEVETSKAFTTPSLVVQLPITGRKILPFFSLSQSFLELPLNGIFGEFVSL